MPGDGCLVCRLTGDMGLLALPVPVTELHMSQGASSSAPAVPPLQSSGSRAPAPVDAGFEMVWNGNIPRLMRRMPLKTAMPAPDFDGASSRALSTARRLNLPHQHVVGTTAALSDTSASLPASARQMPSAASRGYQAARRLQQLPAPSVEASRTRAAIPQVWLAPEQRDFLDVLKSKRRDISGLLSRGRDDARAAVCDVSALWHQPSKGRAAESLTRLRIGVPDTPIEKVLLQKLDASEKRRAGDAAVAAMRLAPSSLADW